jgi:hypothetical protein
MVRMVLGALCGLMLWGMASASLAQGSTQICVGGPADGGSRLCTGARSQSASLVDPRSASVVVGSGSRLNRQRNRNGVYIQQPTATQILATTQSQMNTANVDCRVVDASLLGYNADQQGVYEVSCGSGMGYVVAASSPPQVTDCVTLSARAQIAHTQDPAAPPALACKLEGNRNTTRMVAAYARDAGVGCAVDQSAMVGMSTAGNAVYEVGCPGAEGYWVENTAGGWTATPCLKVAATGTPCRFTTDQEEAATLRSWLAGTTASACDVTGARFMGTSGATAYYEAKCGSGEGYVARIGDAMTVQQVFPCEEAFAIGGGCKLTVVPE